MTSSDHHRGGGARVDDVRAYYRTVSRFIDLELDSRGDTGFWRAVAAQRPPPAILELGAGTGRITRCLAEGAGTVVALDLSLAMLARARRRLADRPHVRLLAADMRHLPLSGRFDLVVAANDPFVHLQEDRDRDRALAEVAAHLAPGGRFYLDAHRMRPGMLARAGRPGGLVRTRSVGDDESGITVRETWRCDPETSLCTARYEYFREGERLEEASFRARLWRVREIEERLGAAGLRVRSLWGSYDRDPWDAETSRRLVVEAERADDTDTDDEEDR